jgi:hypothetical protein
MSCPSLSSPEAPARSAEQRREALALANRVRHQRACLKADLKRGSLSLATIIMEPPEYLASAKLLDLLIALPRYGRARATRLLEDCRISPKKSVGGLSARQCHELLEALER